MMEVVKNQISQNVFFCYLKRFLGGEYFRFFLLLILHNVICNFPKCHRVGKRNKW